MKKYENPILEIIKLSNQDIIQTSGTVSGGTTLENAGTGEIGVYEGGKLTFN